MEAATVQGEETERLFARVQDLQARLESVADPATRQLADELVAALMQMYGGGLEAVLQTLFAAGPDGERLAAELAANPLVATLLLIHDLHPVPLEDRVLEALERVRPYMQSHGGQVELLSVERGVARIRLQGSCSDCSASSVTLELAIKQALEELAPDLDGLEVEGITAQTMGGPGLPMVTGSGPTGIELPVVVSPATNGAATNGAVANGAGPAGSSSQPSWFDVPSVAELAAGAMAAVSVAGSDLVVANVDGTLLAYRDTCAACRAPLHDGELRSGALACRACRRSFFLPRAGRSMDDEQIQLQPVPLLREQGHVRVALAP
jgi:Fe-S cluster biogenesis protein NfuA/nitrite reductase/ring-hydroxylating ferredoxin subunit